MKSIIPKYLINDTLILVYSVIPPASLAYTLNLIYQKHDKYGWHLHYLIKYFITLSFLPLLYIEALDLGIIPQSSLSVVLIVTTVILAVAGIKPAIKNKILYFYTGGIFAGFMEEILYRGVIFGLAQYVWNDVWISLAVSSFAFGVWHLKNYWWHRDKNGSQFNLFIQHCFMDQSLDL